jgi:hypothetical protein
MLPCTSIMGEVESVVWPSPYPYSRFLLGLAGVERVHRRKNCLENKFPESARTTVAMRASLSEIDPFVAKAKARVIASGRPD